MNDEDLRMLTTMQRELDAERIRRMSIENNYNQDAQVGQDNRNIIEFQLNLQDELDRIYHLLKGDVLLMDDEGNSRWQEPEDDRLKILSDYGVKQIMNIIYFYINKNTLLSNYDEEMIFWKVKDFGTELADLIFNRYEAFFSYPSPEELYRKYYVICKRENLNITPMKLYEKCIQWSKEELQSKLRHYPIIIQALVDSVHSTYLRALKGEERESLRRNTNIHATYDNRFPQEDNQNKFKLFKPTAWAKS